MENPTAYRSSRNSVKILALLSVVRWKNVLATLAAQYLAVFFTFNVRQNFLEVIQLYKIHFIILSTALIVAAGYIINNFYDVERDLVNKPEKTRFQGIIPRSLKLKLYFALNTFGLAIAFIASVRIFIFFLVFAFLLWFYSHKLSRIPFVREISASLLSVMAFFSIGLYFNAFNIVFFVYGFSLFLFIFTREILKGVNSLKGDTIFNYESIASRIGSQNTVYMSMGLILIGLMADALLIIYPEKFYLTLAIALIVILKVLMLIALPNFIKNSNWRLILAISQISIFIYILGIVWL